MEFHSIALFFHIVGGLGLFIALGLEWTRLRQIRSAMLFEQVPAFVGILKSADRLLYTSMLISAITGIISMLLEDGLEAWIVVTLGAFFLVIVLVKALTGSRVVDLERALAIEKRQLSHS